MHAVPRTPSFPILAVLCGALLAGCEQPSTAPAALASKPRLNFANGPAAAGLNVFRSSDSSGGFFIFDATLDLLVVEGLPADPSTLYLCEGGTNPASTLDYQQVGWIRGVVHNHALGQDVTVHVYRLSDNEAFRGDVLALFCRGTPLAAGTGRASLQDNDLFSVSGKTHAATFTIAGWATDLHTGALLHVTARAHTVVDLKTDPPTVTVDDTRIRLQPVGGR